MSPEPTPAISASADRAQPSERYKLVRGASRTLCEPLCIEDYVVQSMPDASPTLWHLAHTTWFFETFVLKPHCPGYRPWSEGFEYLFNSYYNSVGPAFPRPRRGLLTRPTVRDVMRYRAYVDEHVLALLERGPPNVASVVELGLQHEQ
ncbi:MAG: DinB family protein, partial [Proteobacteria bacterium]|nr:DinB family protein [Pseudomonadota bacterium]